MTTSVPTGDLVVRRTDDGPVIEQADARILIADEFLTQMRAGDMDAVTVEGDTVTFVGINRTVVYHLTGSRDPYAWYADLVAA